MLTKARLRGVRRAEMPYIRSASNNVGDFIDFHLSEVLILFSFVGARKKGVDLDCVYCRAPWALSGTKGAGSKTSEGYINLAHVAGVSPIRDTSSCKSAALGFLDIDCELPFLDYHGPRRGQRYYGYQDYDDY